MLALAALQMLQCFCLGREGEFYILQFPQPVFEFLDRFGELPLPPYIERDDESADNDQDLKR